MIIASFQVDNQMRAYLQQTDIPVIGVDIPAQSYGNASIGIDNVDGMRKAVQLLRSLGHSTIGFVTDYIPADMVYSTVERARIFKQVAQEQGLDQLHAPIISLSEYEHFIGNEQIANELVSRILGLVQRPTALCVQTDASAIAVIKALRNQGIRVPEDMSVVGFDDADIADIAELTTLRQDPYAMGVIAARKTLDLLRGVELEHPHELLPARIILRSTTQLAKGLA